MEEFIAKRSASARQGLDSPRGARSFASALLAVVLAATGAAAEDDDLFEMDLEALGSLDIEVTSVSKREQKISHAAAAIAVITGEDIRRAGHTSIPEALRMVPGLDVRRIDSSRWSIGARGFTGEFANKLLVLIDGRSVYTPLFAGVYWDVQDVVMEDIERIEVIRGPGATVWGANAVNGVINVITKRAEKTQGTMVSALGGHRIENGTGVVRYGGKSGEDTHYRVYGKYLNRRNFEVDGREDEGNDDWWQGRGGFRVDHVVSEDTELTIQGDAYGGEVGDTSNVFDIDPAPAPFGTITPITVKNETEVWGANLIGKVDHDFGDGQNFTGQAYYDVTFRDTTNLREIRHTADLDFQHSFAMLDERLSVIWGLGYRMVRGETDGTFVISLEPEDQTDHLASGFVQGEYELLEDLLRVTVGTKIEHNDYTRFEFQPSARAVVTPDEAHTVWASVSRAIRSPSVVNDDLNLILSLSPNPAPPPGTGFVRVLGSNASESEELIAYELGYRFTPEEQPFNVDLALFVNQYDHNSTIRAAAPAVEPGAPTLLYFDNEFANRGDALSWGGELQINWTPVDWWHLTASYSYISIDFDERGVTNIADTSAEGSSNHLGQIRSSMSLPCDVELDTMLYGYDNIAPDLDDFLRLDVRVGWKPMDGVDLSLVGQNLTNRRTPEAVVVLDSGQSLYPRSFFARATVGF